MRGGGEGICANIRETNYHLICLLAREKKGEEASKIKRAEGTVVYSSKCCPPKGRIVF